MTHPTRTIVLLFFGLFGLGMLLLYINSDTNTDAPTLSRETSTATQETPSVVSDLTSYETRVKNAGITVPDTSVNISLVDGRASYGTNLDGGDVTLIKVIGGERFSATRTHVYADIAVQSGGTGVFHYVGLFEVTGDKVTHLSSYFIGDRINLISARATPKTTNAYTLTVSYLDRKEGEPMVEDPSVQKEITVEVKNNLFVEKSL